MNYPKKWRYGVIWINGRARELAQNWHVICELSVIQGVIREFGMLAGTVIYLSTKFHSLILDVLLIFEILIHQFHLSFPWKYEVLGV